MLATRPKVGDTVLYTARHHRRLRGRVLRITDRGWRFAPSQEVAVTFEEDYAPYEKWQQNEPHNWRTRPTVHRFWCKMNSLIEYIPSKLELCKKVCEGHMTMATARKLKETM